MRNKQKAYGYYYVVIVGTAIPRISQRQLHPVYYYHHCLHLLVFAKLRLVQRTTVLK